MYRNCTYELGTVLEYRHARLKGAKRELKLKLDDDRKWTCSSSWLVRPESPGTITSETRHGVHLPVSRAFARDSRRNKGHSLLWGPRIPPLPFPLLRSTFYSVWPRFLSFGFFERFWMMMASNHVKMWRKFELEGTRKLLDFIAREWPIIMANYPDFSDRKCCK